MQMYIIKICREKCQKRTGFIVTGKACMTLDRPLKVLTTGGRVIVRGVLPQGIFTVTVV